MRDRARALEAILDMSQELLALEGYDEILDTLVQRSLSLLGGDRGFLLLLRGEAFDFKVIRNWSPEEYEGGKEPISRSILTEVLSRNTPLLIEDAAADPRFQGLESIQDLYVRSVLAAPLSVEGEMVGALYLESRSMRRFFGEEELELFTRILGISSRVLEAVMRRLLLEQIEQRSALLERDLSARYRFPGIVTQDPGFLRLLETLAQAAPSNLPVLLQGPSGTGKELLARALHCNSQRARRPFLTVNCGAISPALLESELFGYVKGAFTGATQNKVGLITAAHSGTLFLDEVSELPKELQVKLLRTLQFGEVQPVGSTSVQILDVRFVAATNRDLEEEVSEGRFREDLFYRLNAVTFFLPSLKDRPGDILPLFYHFLARDAEKAGRPVPQVGQDLEQVLEAYPWPGNVRELENETRRLLALSPPLAPLTPARLSSRITARSEKVREKVLRGLAEQIRECISEHLKAAAGNRTRAAETLGITREGLRKMMKRYHLE